MDFILDEIVLDNGVECRWGLDEIGWVLIIGCDKVVIGWIRVIGFVDIVNWVLKVFWVVVIGWLFDGNEFVSIRLVVIVWVSFLMWLIILVFLIFIFFKDEFCILFDWLFKDIFGFVSRVFVIFVWMLFFLVVLFNKIVLVL